MVPLPINPRSQTQVVELKQVALLWQVVRQPLRTHPAGDNVNPNGHSHVKLPPINKHIEFEGHGFGMHEVVQCADPPIVDDRQVQVSLASFM